jgi:hypothetical protein
LPGRRDKKVLSFKQFYRLYYHLHQFSNVSLEAKPKQSDIISLSSSLDEADSDECPVCLDREPDTVLPCTHAFCSECISEWYATPKYLTKAALILTFNVLLFRMQEKKKGRMPSLPFGGAERR